MNIEEKVKIIVFDSIKEIGEDLQNPELQNPHLETPLFGRKGNLDSLGLVNLLTAIEDRVSKQLEININLTDEKAVSQRRSPFLNAKRLIDFVEKLVKEV